MINPTFPTLKDWPRLKNRQPIFEDTAQALFYAQLIWQDLEEQKMLQFYRDDCYTKLKHVREQKDPDPDAMFALAVNAQFFRECLEECARISNEPYQVPPRGAYLHPGV